LVGCFCGSQYPEFGSCMGGVHSVRWKHSLHISQRLCLTSACVVFLAYTPFSSTCTHVTAPPCCQPIIRHRYHESLHCHSHHRFHFAAFWCSTVTCPGLFNALSWRNLMIFQSCHLKLQVLLISSFEVLPSLPEIHAERVFYPKLHGELSDVGSVNFLTLSSSHH